MSLQKNAPTSLTWYLVQIGQARTDAGIFHSYGEEAKDSAGEELNEIFTDAVIKSVRIPISVK